MVARFARRRVEELGRVAALERRQRIVALARTFERVAARLDRACEIARLARDAAQVLELVVVGLELLVGDAPVLDRHVGRDEALAVALRVVAADHEVAGQEAPVLAVPVHARAAHARRRPERAELAHRKRGLRAIVAEGERLAVRLLEEAVAHGVAQLVLDRGGREVGNGVAEAAALDREDLQPRVGELLREDARGPAEAHQHDVDGRKALRHGHASFPGDSRPASPTHGCAYLRPYCSISAT